MMARRLAALLLLGVTCFTLLTGCSGKGSTVELQGAGATFPDPLYQAWFSDYGQAHSDVRISYQGLGSGAGVKQYTEGLVTFGASDAAMNDKEIEEAKAKGRDPLLVPMTAGKVVVAYNLPNVSNLQLSRKALAGIFLGSVKKWNDDALKECNPGVALPDLPITLAVRADSSGTSFVFTNHLAAISEAFKKEVGAKKDPKWPEATKHIKDPGNDGVTRRIKDTPGSLGYIEYGFAREQKLSMAKLENKSGKYIEPTIASGQAALAGEKLPADFRLFVSDPSATDAYPIVSYTWLLVNKKYDDAAKAKALKEVIKWCLTDGQKKCEELGYLPLPRPIAEEVLKAVETIQP